MVSGALGEAELSPQECKSVIILWAYTWVCGRACSPAFGAAEGETVGEVGKIKDRDLPLLPATV